MIPSKPAIARLADFETRSTTRHYCAGIHTARSGRSWRERVVYVRGQQDPPVSQDSRTRSASPENRRAVSPLPIAALAAQRVAQGVLHAANHVLQPAAGALALAL